jgi:hypothetical protein
MWRLQSKKDWGDVGAVEPASVSLVRWHRWRIGESR